MHACSHFGRVVGAAAYGCSGCSHAHARRWHRLNSKAQARHTHLLHTHVGEKPHTQEDGHNQATRAHACTHHGLLQVLKCPCVFVWLYA